jgi:hypothetical protein
MKKLTFFILTLALCATTFLNGQFAKADGLPDFVVSDLSIRYKAGTNAGYYLYTTIENKGEATTSQSFITVQLTGLAPIGLPDGYVLYLVNEKKDGVYAYPKGYKKEFIGPSVESLKADKITVTATIDPSNYFAESNEANNVFSKAVAKSSSLVEARIIFDSGKNINSILTNSGAKKNVATQKTSMKKNVEPNIKGIKLTDAQKYAINNFIVYGTKSTSKLTQAKRTDTIKKFKAQYKRMPLTVGDWQRVLEIK